MRKRKRPAPNDPRPSNPSSGSGDAVWGSFFALVDDWEVADVLAFWSAAEGLLWSDVDGVVGCAFWSVLGLVAVLLGFWVDWVALGCVAELLLGLLPVCAARHKLASRSGEASHSFFIGKEPPMLFLRINSFP